MNLTAEVQEVAEDFADGKDLMTSVCRRMSSGSILQYAEAAGPVLDNDKDNAFLNGCRDGLASEVDRVKKILPDAICSWPKVTVGV